VICIDEGTYRWRRARSRWAAAPGRRAGGRCRRARRSWRGTTAGHGRSRRPRPRQPRPVCPQLELDPSLFPLLYALRVSMQSVRASRTNCLDRDDGLGARGVYMLRCDCDRARGWPPFRGFVGVWRRRIRLRLAVVLRGVTRHADRLQGTGQEADRWGSFFGGLGSQIWILCASL
jgi:hypothetical protein